MGRRLAALDGVISILVDGSVSYGGYVARYSDIDIKVVVADDAVTERLWLSIRDAVHAASKLCDAPINLWCVRDDELSMRYEAALPPFDFVRRHVLRRAMVLYGYDFRSQVQCPPRVTSHELAVCVSQITTFATRLRRLLTNPVAVSDVRSGAGALLAQQGIAYYFHALRYFLAAAAHVVVPLASLIESASDVAELPPVEVPRAKHLFELRARWAEKDWEHGSAGSTVLSDSENGLRSLCDAIHANRQAFIGRPLRYD